MMPMKRPLRPTAALMALAAVICLGTGCAERLLTCPRAVKVPEPPPPQQHPETVLFVTDRAPESPHAFNFSGKMNLSAKRITYGAICEDPVIGGGATCEKPAWLREELPAQLEKSDLLDGIRAAHSDVVLFVHGFNFSFDESLQIAVRLVQRTGTRAIPVAYSWPSEGKFSAYGVDYDRNEWTIEHLQDFIQNLVNALPDGAVLHIVAHSMGNRALLWALAGLNLPDQHLGQLIMIAPDVDAEIFRDLVSRSGPFRRKTLYVSNHDLALRAAGWLRPTVTRAGNARQEYVVIQGVDTIDMSPLKAGASGHSVYNYSQLLFNDLGAVLKDQDPGARKLNTCKVTNINSYNAAHGTELPCLVYRLPLAK
jgi:esterase/lipase superfamily enzyme